jgi:thiopurine S-methyltransferase
MEKGFWHTRWARNEIGFHQEEINSHLQSFWGDLRLAPGSGVFVPLCGKTRDMFWLRDQGFSVLGVELSEIAVEAFFRESGLQPRVARQGSFRSWEVERLKILQGDFFQLKPEHLQPVGAVFDRASLVALPVAMRTAYAEKLDSLLSDETEILLVTLEYPQQQMEGPPFSVTEEEVRALYSGRHRVEMLHTRDILAENPRFRAKGLGHLDEKVYRLTAAR